MCSRLTLTPCPSPPQALIRSGCDPARTGHQDLTSPGMPGLTQVGSDLPAKGHSVPPPEPSERPPPLRLDPRGPAEHLVQQRTGKSVGTGEQGARPNPQAAEQQQKTNPDPPSSSFPIVTSQECGAFTGEARRAAPWSGLASTSSGVTQYRARGSSDGNAAWSCLAAQLHTEFATTPEKGPSRPPGMHRSLLAPALPTRPR